MRGANPAKRIACFSCEPRPPLPPRPLPPSLHPSCPPLVLPLPSPLPLAQPRFLSRPPLSKRTLFELYVAAAAASVVVMAVAAEAVAIPAAAVVAPRFEDERECGPEKKGLKRGAGPESQGPSSAKNAHC